MAKLSLYEVKQAQLEQIPKIDGQLIVISDTGSIYRDIASNGIVDRILIGNDIIAVDELPLAPISNKIYYLKPNKLYTYNSGWIDLTGGADFTQAQPDFAQNDDAQPDYIKNRPFYDTRIRSYYSQAESPNPISFDCSAINYSFYKISDLILTREQIFSAKIYVDGNLWGQKETNILVESGNDFTVVQTSSGIALAFVGKTGVINFTFSGHSLSVDAPETGVYYVYALGMGVPLGRTVEINLDGELKTLDMKYLPENMALGYDTRKISHYSQAENPNPVSFDCAAINYSFYKVSDLALTREDVFGSTQIIVDGTILLEPKENEILVEADGFIVVQTNGFGLAFASKIGTINFTFSGYSLSVDVPEAGIYYVYALGAGVPEGRTIEIIAGGELKQIDPKFIPSISVDALPEVTTADKGKFLCVDSNGQWVPTAMSEWSGGSY